MTMVDTNPDSRPQSPLHIATPLPVAGRSGASRIPCDEHGHLRSGWTEGFRLKRFLAGFLLSGSGVAIILLIGVSLVHVRLMRAELAMPTVGMAVITGVMLVGGGFGLMATATGGYSDEEFRRLMDGESMDAIHGKPEPDQPQPSAVQPETADECVHGPGSGSFFG